MQERSYSTAIFLKRPFFQNIWGKIGFSCSDYHTPVRVGNCYNNNYIKYGSNGDGNKTY